MAGEWIKMRPGLHKTLKAMQIARALGCSTDDVVGDLYRLASWFVEHGKHGKFPYDEALVDLHLKRPGLAEVLANVGWLEKHDGVLVLKGFCAVSATRKQLSKKIRARVLSTGVCAICNAAEGLVIDHMVPIARGGSCDETNLQALCAPCNRAKGTKTMEEFLRDH